MHSISNTIKFLLMRFRVPHCLFFANEKKVNRRYDIRAPRTTGHQPNWAPVQVGTNTTGHHSELEQQGTSTSRHRYNWAPNLNFKKMI